MNPIRSIGIIMDGNRRWAKARGLRSVDGHSAGADVIEKLGDAALQLRATYGLEYVTLYTFSTENWSRTREEVDFLMNLIRERFAKLGTYLGERKIRVKIIGERERFAPDLQEVFKKIETETAHHDQFTVAFALSYGGRAEILDAVNRLIKKGEMVDEATFSNALWMGQAGVPDPDLIIRTSGEQRLSGFLTWESVYSELFFVDKHWPDFTSADIEQVFNEYLSRDRRRGR